MKTRSGLVETRSYRSTRTVTADWRPVKANDGSPNYVGYVAVPHPTSGSVKIDTFAQWSSHEDALGQVMVDREGVDTVSVLASSDITYDTNRPNKSNLCYRAFEGAWFYEPFPRKAVVWPEPVFLIGSKTFRSVGTMFRAAQFSGYPSTFASQTTYEDQPRNLPSTLEKLSAGRQLAAGPAKGLDGLLTSIIEMKDVPATITGLLSFARFVYNLRKRPSAILSKATLREVVGLYLNFTYGVCPTLSECERFRDDLMTELREARTSIDAMFEAASDSLKKSNRDYRDWLAAREKRDEENRILRQKRREQREAERKARQLEARMLKLRRDQSKALLEAARMSKQELIQKLHSRRLDAYAQLDAEESIRGSIKSSLDDLWHERERNLLEMHTAIQDIASQASYTFEVLEYYRDLAWVNGYSDFRLHEEQLEYDRLMIEIDRIKRESEDYRASVAAFRETILDELERSYAQSADLREYLRDLEQMEDIVANQELHILNLQYDYSRAQEDLENFYSKPQHHGGGRTTYGSTELTRTYNFPDIYISARRRLHKEPGGAPYTTTLDDIGPVSYTVTYRLQGGDVSPNPQEEVKRLLGDALERLYRGHMATLCKQAIVYKQWPLQVLTRFFTPFGSMCDFMHSFLQPLDTLWAVTPWSFVVDWFADLSATFSGVEAEFTRAALGLPEATTWSACSFLALLSTNLDHPVPVSVEQEWLSDPSLPATEHTVRYTFRVNTRSHGELWGSFGDAFVRRPEPSWGVAEFLPPPNLRKVLDHSVEGLALLTQQLLNK